MEILKRSSLLFSTLRLETSAGSVGTGFLAEHPSSEGRCIFLVTNRHVVAGSYHGSVKLNASFSNPDVDVTLGETIPLKIKGKNWEWATHPDPTIDIAILNVTPIMNSLGEINAPAFGVTMAVCHLPSEEKIKKVDVGDSVLFVGYPAGMHDFSNNLPLVRTGSIATLYNDNSVFLIDASVFPGSSGSPVFLKDDDDYNTFLGVLSASLRPPLGLLEETKEYIDFGVVYPSKTVFETIESYLHYYGKSLKISRGDTK